VWLIPSTTFVTRDVWTAEKDVQFRRMCYVLIVQAAKHSGLVLWSSLVLSTKLKQADTLFLHVRARHSRLSFMSHSVDHEINQVLMLCHIKCRENLMGDMS
jgi:hypothetical protein